MDEIDPSIPSSRITAATDAPPVAAKDWHDRWGNIERGVLSSWIAGRAFAASNPVVVASAQRGELPPLPWAGGIHGEPKDRKQRTGTLFYYAFWLGVRGKDLDIDINHQYTIVCARTGISVIFSKAAHPSA